MSRGAEVTWRGAVELIVSEPPLAAPPELERRVQEIWERELAARPSLVNGSLVCFSTISEGRVTGRLTEYRLFVARERDPLVRERIKLQAIGVSGVVVLPDGEILLGRRSNNVTEYPGAWELVPSGSLSAESVSADGSVDTLGALLTELEEETGIDRAAVAQTVPLGMIWDAGQDGFDVCFELKLDSSASLERFQNHEYLQVEAMTSEQAAELISDENGAVPTSRTLLELRGAR